MSIICFTGLIFIIFIIYFLVGKVVCSKYSDNEILRFGLSKKTSDYEFTEETLKPYKAEGQIF